MWSLIAGVLLAAMTPHTVLFLSMPSIVMSVRTAGQVPARPGFERFPYGGTSSGDRPVSPAVVASWIARVGPLVPVPAPEYLLVASCFVTSR